MNLLCMGDLHYRSGTPRSRKDDYVRALMDKMDQILRIGQEHDCLALLQPGDFFDTAHSKFWLVREVLLKHIRNGPPVLAVLGQHDQRYHTTPREDTPIGLLEAAGAVKIMGSKPHLALPISYAPHRTTPQPKQRPRSGLRGSLKRLVVVYGASWGDDIPAPAPSSGYKATDVVNVLLIHRMVIKKEKLWPGQEDPERASALLRKHPEYDLIVCGDNHHFFTESMGKRHLVNCGSLMRSNVDQASHRPSVVLYNAAKRSIRRIELNVAPAEDVLTVETAEADKERRADLDAFIEQIQSNTTPELNFLSVLRSMSNEAPKGVRQWVNRVVEMSNV